MLNIAQMNKWKQLLPDLAALVFFIGVTVVYFYPVLEGKSLPQMDQNHAIGMAQELVELEAETGEKAMWTNSMFGGMPAYQIKGDASANVFSYLNRYSRLGLPYHTMAIVFMYLLGFYVLLRSMGFSHWLSALGGVAFALGSYNIIIIIAGHITKAYAIALMAPVLGGILYTYNKNKWLGALFTTVALGAEIAYNHVQITYYLALLVLVLVADRLIRAWKGGSLNDFAQRTGLLAVAAILAVLPNLTNLWTTYEYGKESIRGQALLEDEEREKTQRGLDPDYAFAWSYGRAETLTLMIPNFHGGASEPIGFNEQVTEGLPERIDRFLRARGISYGQQQGQFINQLANEIIQQSQYWGSKPFTSGPVYVGALICFFFVLALFYYQGREKWWLLAGTILSILLAWGHNLEWFNMLMFDYFPLYNKFRTVEMALVIATVSIPLLGMLGLRSVIENPQLIREKSGGFMWSLGLTAGVALLFYLFPNLLSFFNAQELAALQGQMKAQPEQAVFFELIMQELHYARMLLLKTDAFRSLVFILLGSASLWLYARSTISRKYLIPGLLLLVLVDLWAVDRRYLNQDHFITKSQARQTFRPTQADLDVLADPDPNFRVFSVHRNVFNEVHTSYFHKSIGGYHGAKLQRYQDLIDHYLQSDWQLLRSITAGNDSIALLQEAMGNFPVLNMLNTRYIIYHPEKAPLLNPQAQGAAWLVNEVFVVNSPKEEIEALQQVDLRKTAVVSTEFANLLSETTMGAGEGNIQLSSYHPERLTYEVNTGARQLAVFSEVYYGKGWKAYVNDEEVPLLRVNYLLRAAFVPEGSSTVELRFEPRSYRWGKVLAALSSVLILALLAYAWWRRRELKA